MSVLIHNRSYLENNAHLDISNYPGITIPIRNLNDGEISQGIVKTGNIINVLPECPDIEKCEWKTAIMLGDPVGIPCPLVSQPNKTTGSIIDLSLSYMRTDPNIIINNICTANEDYVQTEEAFQEDKILVSEYIENATQGVASNRTTFLELFPHLEDSE